MPRRLIAALCFCVLSTAPEARADVPLPANVMDPANVPEAWNVLRLTRANVQRLLQEKRLSEVAPQVALCSPALRRLAKVESSPERHQIIDQQTLRAFQNVNAVAQSAMVQSQIDADKAFTELQSALTALEAAFDPKEVRAEIYYCLVHPEVTATSPEIPCKKCAAALRLRRIPYSFVYVTPPAAPVKLQVLESAPLEAGKKAEIKVRLSTPDGTALTPADFLIIHSQPVQLLITDAALGGYQVVQPSAGAAPGDYCFSFTPAQSGPHRLWADIVPIATGLQELPWADISGAVVPAVGQANQEIVATTVEGFNFQLGFSRVNGSQAVARKIQVMSLKVTDSTGQPVPRLEPIMNAFADVTGVYEDGQTLLRLHPTGGEVFKAEQRGGPLFHFKFYPPRGGHLRLYVQVRLDGRTLTVPLAVNVVD